MEVNTKFDIRIFEDYGTKQAGPAYNVAGEQLEGELITDAIKLFLMTFKTHPPKGFLVFAEHGSYELKTFGASADRGDSVYLIFDFEKVG